MAELLSAMKEAINDLYRRRVAAQTYRPKPATRVLLVFSESMKQSDDELRDHLGHALLYLRSPKAHNECSDAGREWRASTRQRLRRHSCIQSPFPCGSNNISDDSERLSVLPVLP